MAAFSVATRVADTWKGTSPPPVSESLARSPITNRDGAFLGRLPLPVSLPLTTRSADVSPFRGFLMRILLALSLVALACLAPAAAVAQERQAPPPLFRSGVDIVTVDVTVLSRGGDPVAGLGIDDFVLTVDGKPRKILALLPTKSGIPEKPVDGGPILPTASLYTPRRFVIVVDREHLPLGESQQAMAAAARFLDTLPPDDRVALWTTGEAAGSLNFDETRAAIKHRLARTVGAARASVGTYVVGRDEALKVEEGGAKELLQELVDRNCRQLGQADPVLLDTCKHALEAQVRQTAMEARNAAERVLSSLRELVARVAELDGPKHVVLVTQGPVMTREAVTEITSLGRRAGDARVTVHALQVRDPELARVEERGAAPEIHNQSQSAAFFLATTTGGLAMTPVTGEIGFSRLATQLSAGYLAIFETESSDRDGKPHAIGVKVSKSGWGGLVRARNAFVAGGRPTSVVAAAAQPAAAQPGAPPPATPAAPIVPLEPVGTDPGDMANRLAEYAEAFERDIAAIVAQERSVQIIQPWRGAPSAPDKEPALQWVETGSKGPKTGPIMSRRQMVADVLMVQRKGQQWQSYRDVAEVDGQAVRDRENRVQRLFLAGEGGAAFQQIALESARYNLGDVKRDLNLPTVALSFLRRTNQPRFQFKRQKDETLDGRPCRVLAYREKVSPTIVSTRNSDDIYLYGRVWLDQADGRVRRTELRFDRGNAATIIQGAGTGQGGSRSYIRVDYGEVEGLDTLVPVRMWEWHEGVNQLGRIGGDYTGLQALATYSNYRRFNVTTSEKIKQ